LIARQTRQRFFLHTCALGKKLQLRRPLGLKRDVQTRLFPCH